MTRENRVVANGASCRNVHLLLLGDELDFALHIVRTRFLDFGRWLLGFALLVGTRVGSATLSVAGGSTHDDRNTFKMDEEVDFDNIEDDGMGCKLSSLMNQIRPKGNRR